MILLVAMFAANAQESADIEVTWPAVGCADRGAMISLSERGEDVCMGFGLQGAIAPLVWHDPAEDDDDWRIDTRVTGTFSIAAKQGRGWAFSLALPIVHQEGSDVSGDSQQAVADLMLAEEWRTQVGRYEGGAQIAIRLPSGKNDAWIGERFPRARLMGSAGARFGTHRLGAQAGLSLRFRDGDTAEVATGPRAFYNLGWLATISKKAEAWANIDGRVDLIPSHRPTFSSPVEARVGLSILGQYASVDAYVGRALYAGVGSSMLRLGVVLRANLKPTPGEVKKPAAAEPVDEWMDRPAPDLDDVDDLPDRPDPVAAPAKPVDSTPPPPPSSDLPSVLLTTLLFEQGTATLRPESEPELRRLSAQLLQQTGLGPMLIEGHASEEGTFAFNYELSLSRASTIYLALIEAGVRPERLTMRARGEVSGSALADVDQRRRVEVRLIVDAALIDGPVLNPLTGEEVP